MARRTRDVALLAVLGAGALWTGGCGGGPQDVFEEHALPVLQSRCATPACHGVAPGTSYPAADWLFFRLDERGAIADPEQAREAALQRAVTAAPPMLSTLLRVPMPRWADGGPHAGVALFTGPDDPAAQSIVRWIESEPVGSGGEDVELTDRERLFGDTVLPVLISRCGFAGCHGSTEVAFTAFGALPDRDTGLFAPREIRRTYRTVRKHLDLWGADSARSRLIRKALGPLAGGLVHRGGESTYFPEAPDGRPLEAPDLEALHHWARLEREALGVVEGQTPSAMVFVRGPASARAPYRIEAGPVGSDLYLTSWPPAAGSEENLTASLHPTEPAEVRDPAVSHDGQRVAFALRGQAEAHFALWEIDLGSRAARRVSPEGATGSFVQPTYTADGRIAAAWDGHGEVGSDGDGVPPELVAIDADGDVQRLTWTPAPEMSPAMLASGKTRGELIFGIRRNHSVAGTEGVLFRFPLCHDDTLHGEPEYHVQFGATLAPLAPLVARDLPDGRQIMIVLEHTEVTDDRGRLGVLDRALGPILPEGAEGAASVGGYLPAVSWVDAEPRWRDPAALPDGRILAAADDPATPGQDAIHLVAIADGVDGASMGSTQLVVSAPGESVRSPVPIYRRPFEDDGHEPIIDPRLEVGFFALRDVAVLEAIYGRPEPRDPRPLREEIRGLRLITWSGAQASDFAVYADGGTTVGLSNRAPAAVLAEHVLPEDRSAWIEVPARTPILLQFLDARNMVVGNQLDRWFYAEGAESVPGGTNTKTYDHDCTGCHGSLSGRPQDAAGAVPDAIAAASITLSTHRNRDRRHPLTPTVTPHRGVPIDFRATIGPLLEESCASAECHGGDPPPAGLALDGRAGAGRFPAAYEELMTRFVDRDRLRARASPLVERLLGEELDAPAPVTGRCLPDGVDDAFLAQVARWIESGAFYDVSAREGSR